MKRQRGRGRKNNNNSGHNQSNRHFDSNGPDVKIRGSASHIYEKYQQLARDATSSGDRVMAENYLQHAEHYFRILQSAPKPAQHRDGGHDHRDHAHGQSDDEGGRHDAEADGMEIVQVDAGDDGEGDGEEQTADAELQRAKRPRRRSRFRPGGGEGRGDDGGEGAPVRVGATEPPSNA